MSNTTTATPTPVEPFSALLTYFIAKPDWHVTIYLARRRENLYPQLEVRCGSKLVVRFYWDEGNLTFRVYYWLDASTSLEKVGRIGVATGQSDGYPLCALDPHWSDSLRAAMAAISNDLLNQQATLQAIVDRS